MLSIAVAAMSSFLVQTMKDVPYTYPTINNDKHCFQHILDGFQPIVDGFQLIVDGFQHNVDGFQ